jgi:hypothetical protein
MIFEDVNEKDLPLWHSAEQRTKDVVSLSVNRAASQVLTEVNFSELKQSAANFSIVF